MSLRTEKLRNYMTKVRYCFLLMGDWKLERSANGKEYIRCSFRTEKNRSTSEGSTQFLNGRPGNCLIQLPFHRNFRYVFGLHEQRISVARQRDVALMTSFWRGNCAKIGQTCTPLTRPNTAVFITCLVYSPNVPASLLTLASVIPALWAHSLITMTSGFTLGSHSEKHFKRKAFRTLVQFSTLMSVSNDFSLSLSLMIGTLAFGTTYTTEDSFEKPCNCRSMNPGLRSLFQAFS